ncbi:hypothetical protein [Prauserella rugosa]|uniref:X-X-X-Leu-X-X-Gly heptad repeat protein n=1 Tax=Prauserella rugosa TaxID=43354 RepID=A0A660C7Q3_9PSEU|nr:hypothetical protein [Prauserella rugosa]KMS84770.1 hypothetical protein ACZ91_45965 [Streptomyces regensis]TWH18414.1 X-X-X-Leu-X-X-Gly heptad repeat protein [Prauserella rugosa]
MISCAVVVPSAPLLVPELVPGSRLGDEVRAAAVDAASRLPSRWLAVGVGTLSDGVSGLASGVVESDRVGTFRAFGPDVPVTLRSEATGTSGSAATGTSADDTSEDLPLSVLIAGWLRDQAGAESVRAHLVAADASPAECAAFGEKLAAGEAATDPASAWGLLVVGDGSARRDTAPPGEADERAEGFDRAVAAALAGADVDALAELDPVVARELRAEGRAPWQVLAGFARARGGDWAGELVYSEAPRGVGYHVAVWRPSE